jgi:hypothetical protein
LLLIICLATATGNQRPTSGGEERSSSSVVESIEADFGTTMMSNRNKRQPPATVPGGFYCAPRIPIATGNGGPQCRLLYSQWSGPPPLAPPQPARLESTLSPCSNRVGAAAAREPSRRDDNQRPAEELVTHYANPSNRPAALPIAPTMGTVEGQAAGRDRSYGPWWIFRR